MSINEKSRQRKLLARIGGNFGVSFFGPLISGNVAQTVFDIGISFQDALIIAAIAALFQTGYMVSLEVRAYGEKKGVSNS